MNHSPIRTQAIKEFLLYTILWLTALSIGLWFRCYPLTQFTSKQSEEKASVYVINNIRQQITKQVQINNPTMDTNHKNLLIKRMLDQTISTDKKKIQATIYQVAKEIEQSSPSREKPYLLASDSFYYFGLTKNIQKDGKIAEKRKGSKYLNELMLTPTGHWEPYTLHPYIGFFVYKICVLFNPDISLMEAVGYTPLVITAFALIPFMFICRIFFCSWPVTFTASVYFLLAPIFIKRSTYGWYDNDPYNILFPLAILAVLFFGLQKGNKPKRMVPLGIKTSLLMMLYALFWQGWVFLYGIIIFASIIALTYNHFILKQKIESRKLFTFLILVNAGSFLFIGIIFGFNEFFILFKEGWIALKNFMDPQLSPWPDLYFSVGELHRVSFHKIIESWGGLFFFITALIGCCAAVIQSFRCRDFLDPLKLIFVYIFAGISVMITLGAQRFAMLSLVPLSILFALGLQFYIKTALCGLKIILPNEKSKQLISIFVSVLLMTLIIFPIKSIDQSMRSILNPIYNKTWEDSMLYIKNKTPENSVINSWWPPGHFIKAIAERRVSFDGASINYPQAYWISNMLLATDEKEALGYLRMLNTSGNQAAEYLQEVGFSLSDAVRIIKLIVPLAEFKARILLTQKIHDQNIVNHLLSLTHAAPPPSYFLFYNEMIEKHLQFAFIGKWNFEKIELINRTPSLLSKVPSRKSDDYNQFLWGLAGGLPRISDELHHINTIGDTALFEHNVQINLKNKDVNINSSKFGKGIPKSIFFAYNNEIVERTFQDATLNYSVILYNNGDDYGCLLMDRLYAKSMMMRLYYFDGKGLEYFHLINTEQDLTKRHVMKLFEIDWDKLQNN